MALFVLVIAVVIGVDDITAFWREAFSQWLDGLPAAQIRDLPGDLTERFGLTQLVSPLRMRGMSAMLDRIRRQIANLPR